MTNIIVQIVLCLAAWAVVLIRLRSIRWEDAHKNNAIALKIWLMMVFVAIGLICYLDFAAIILDAYTVSNLSRLVAYCSFLIAINLGVIGVFDAVGKDADKPLIRYIRLLLVVIIIVLGIIYTLFLSRMPQFSYYETPHSLPEAVFRFIVHSFGIVQSLAIIRMFLAYLPSETSAVMRTRVRMIIVGNFVVELYWLVVIAVIAGYFWPALASPLLIDFTSVLLACALILHFAAFLNNSIYIRFVLLARNIKNWYAFQDLQYLMKRMVQMFPVIGLPPGNPNFFQFVLNPEKYLYPAIILILDGRSMLNDFLAEASDVIAERAGEKGEEEDDLLDEALEVHRALQSVETPDDFYEMVEVYRHASREFWKSQRVVNFS